MVLRPFPAHGRGGPRIREIPLRMVLPNLVTVLAICAGLSGIRLAFEARFETAVAMVLFAAFLDGIDGRLARMMKATSKFGAQMDSLADIVNFGVAPALVLYAFLLDRAGSPGWIAALLFAIACGLRLARFNVLDEDLERPAWQAEYFVGVPAPAGAVLVMLPVYLAFIGAYEPSRVAAFVASGFTVLAAFLLVSRIPVYSGKKLRVARDRVLPLILAVALGLLLLFTYPWQTLSAGVTAYLLFLPLSARAYAKRTQIEDAKAAEAAAAEAVAETDEVKTDDGPAAKD
jgi:CDP-diacylglycerol--serine O-phosphatidyltransferase